VRVRADNIGSGLKLSPARHARGAPDLLLSAPGIRPPDTLSLEMKRHVPLLTTALLLALGTAPATAAASDIASTRAYVQANYTLVREASSRIPRARAAIAGVLHRVTSECPHIAAGSPQDPESTQMSNEVIGAMVTSAYHLDLPALAAFIHVAERSRWSNRGLTSTVHAYAAKLRVLSALPEPNLCADARAWIAGGYHTLPASTVAFAPRFMEAWVALGELPPQLRPYERGEQRGMLSRSNLLEEQLTEFEAASVDRWGEIMNEIGLNP
jgi:hypothetical protein